MNPPPNQPPDFSPARGNEVDYCGGSIFQWREGMPYSREGKSMAKEQVQKAYHASAANLYKGDWDPITQTYQMDPEFLGMTNVEVIVERHLRRAASGDLKAIEGVMDRLVGKPKQSVESVSMTLSYTEYLDILSEKEDTTDTASEGDEIIDVHPDIPGHILDAFDDDYDQEDVSLEMILDGI